MPKTDIEKSIPLFLEVMFGIRKNLQEFYVSANNDTTIKSPVQQGAGLTPSCFPFVFEAFVNAFSCQQISPNLGIILLNLLSEIYWLALDDDSSLVHAFPRPEDLVGLAPGDLRKLVFSHQECLALIGFAHAAVGRGLTLDTLKRSSEGKV